MAYPGTFVAGQVLTAAEMNAINEGASARPLLTGGAYIDGTNGLVLSGIAGNYAQTPDSAAVSVTGDIDIRVRVAMDDWTPSASQIIVAKYQAAGTRSYWLALKNTGVLFMRTSNDGTAVLSTDSTAAVGAANGTFKWIRATLDVDDGAGNRVYEFFTSDDGTTWTQLGTTVTVAGTTTIYDSTVPLEIGAVNAGTNDFVRGTISNVQVLDGIGGTVVFDADFSAEAADTLAFTEDSSNAATVSVTTTRYTVGIPGQQFASVATISRTNGIDYYEPFQLDRSIEVDMFLFDVTTGPASTANHQLAIYAADNDYQPTGNVLATATVSVATSATGTFYAQITPVTLTPGAYVVAYNSAQNMTFRRFFTGFGQLRHTIGGNPFYVNLRRTRANAAFANNPLPWDTRDTSSATEYRTVALRWKAV